MFYSIFLKLSSFTRQVLIAPTEKMKKTANGINGMIKILWWEAVKLIKLQSEALFSWPIFCADGVTCDSKINILFNFPNVHTGLGPTVYNFLIVGPAVLETQFRKVLVFFKFVGLFLDNH